MNRKNIPLILMLVAGAVTCIITYIQEYSIVDKLVSLLIVLLIFYALGSILSYTLNRFEEQIEQKRQEELEAEGDVIEKDVDAEQEDTRGETAEEE